MTDGLVLRGLDGSNPLAFLAAVGTLRLLKLDRPEHPPGMRWVRDGVWRPQITGFGSSEQTFCEQVCKGARDHLPIDSFSALQSKNITVDKEKFAAFAKTASDAAREGERLIADFATSFGCEACEKEGKDRIEYTDLCFITGSGHQHFLGTMEGLAKSITPQHIQDALFGPWKRIKGFSMRWDPSDAAEYAFRWGDPSQDGASSVWGANLLAVHALPLFPTQPTDRGLRTTGFRDGGRGQWSEFTWPMWTDPISFDTLRSLLAMEALQEPEMKLDHRALRSLGIQELYRSPRVRIGQGANFKVSFRPARAV